MDDTYKVIVVDDEPHARQRLRDLLAFDRKFTVVRECADGHSAVESIRGLSPDVVFLDIGIPGLNGLEVVRELGASATPLTVFVTAFEQHALQAFEANAIDYLLKPYTEERFRTALARVAARLSHRAGIQERLDSLLQTLGVHSRYLDRLVVRSGSRLLVVNVADVTLIASEGNYVRLHTGGKSFLSRETMTNLEAKLDPRHFVRVQRSAIVRIDAIRELQSVFQGEYVIVLRDGTKVNSSRSYRARLEAAVKIVA